jgi:Pyruvate/2-oxoacid:ferredoxin oxidoreductase delta subunit
MKLLKFNFNQRRVDFCDGCGSVCDERCRAKAARDRAIDRAIAGRVGI